MKMVVNLTTKCFAVSRKCDFLTLNPAQFLKFSNSGSSISNQCGSPTSTTASRRNSLTKRAPRKRKTSPLQPPSPPPQPEAGPSTSSSMDIVAEEVEIPMVEIGFTENEPEIYTPTRKSTMKKKIAAQDKIIKKQRKILFNKELRLQKYRQRSIRAKKRVAKMKNVMSELRDKCLVGEEGISFLQGISSTSQFLVKRQIQKARGKRLQKKYDEKLRSFALSLHYISPRAYEYVRQQFDTCLPHSKTLAMWYKTVNAEPGFCTEAFNAIKAYCSANDGPIVTSLMVDSMSIKQDVKWDGTKHVGYVNFGVDYDDDSVPHAKEALVFLLNCINGSWKYPIAYFFVAGVSAEQLAALVKQGLTLLHEAGVIVASLTFDGAAANISMATNLGCSFDLENLVTHFPHPVTNDQIWVFLDPCHMLKLVRNTVGEKDIISSEGNVRWAFISQLFDLQDTEGLRLANKLTKGHMNWQDQKMKVRLAAQTLSESVATAIEYCREKGMGQFAGSEATCSFLKNFNDLFDILNSRSTRGFGTKKALNVSNYEMTKGFFEKMVPYIKELKNEKGVQLVKSNRKVGFLGFIVCMSSALGMYEDQILSKKNLSFLPMYKISQDHLELLFAKIRSKGGWNNNPTAIQFKSALKKIIVATELLDLKSGNCIPLESVSILHATSSSAPSSNPVMNINLTCERTRSLEEECEPDPLFDHGYISLPENLCLSEITNDIVYYIGGFVVRHLKKKLMCEECITSLENFNPVAMNLVTLKSRGGLIHPSSDVHAICCLAEKHFRAKFVSRGPNDCSRLVSCGQITKLDIQKATSEIVQKCIGTSIFNSLSQHSLSQEFGSNHLVNLIKAISTKYFDIRLHYAAKRTTDLIHSRKKRQSLTHAILFQGL
ncbi:hypothetical protein M8J77_014103 [Diaphorina citri]|nr:hypothetical protein M8J77_014103 [Diaphorina citri]